jgi:hypothetical protein
MQDGPDYKQTDLNAHQLEALLLKPGHNLADQASVHTIWFDFMCV